MDNKFIGLIIGLVVGVVLIGSLLVPVMKDTATTEEKYTNDGFFYATYLNDESTDVLSYDYTNPTILNVNGTEIDMSSIDSSYDNVSVAFSDKWFIRYAISTSIIYLYETDTESTSAASYASPSTQKNFNLTCSGGTATIIIGDDTFSETISGDGLIITSEKAEYVMKKSATAAYVNGDSLVYGAGRTDRALGVSGSSYNAIFKASVDDGVSIIGMSPNTYTVTDSSVSSVDESGYVLDLYKLTSFGIALTDGTNSGTITYNQIFVPSEVTAERAQHMSSSENALILVIPVLFIVSLVIFAVRFINRD